MAWWWKLAGLAELALGVIFLCIGILDSDAEAYVIAAGATVMGMQMLNIGWVESKYQLLAQRYVTTRIELLALKAKVVRHENL
ncbi:hypothetical protein cgR_p0004 (plasmid) [Corynebacterium glutamicum R]|uniref:Uncharacterized protein n=2 Tax=Corynebacterium glutamicum TaxID=1718 RepID=A0AB72VF09_CORGB|nr:hypothetical protein cgR_p0004 [Corynebacterium glutamicum R]